MSWAKVAIVLAGVTAGLAITLQRLGEYCGISFPELTHFFAYTPAFLLGVWYWLNYPTFSRSWPVLAFAIMPILGLLYTVPEAGNTPLVVAAFLTMGIPIASLITAQRWWIPTARLFVFASLAALLLILFLDYQVHDGSLGNTLAWFGYTWLESGERSTNPNQVGGQFALAAVMGMVLFLRSGRPGPSLESLDGRREDEGHGTPQALSRGLSRLAEMTPLPGTTFALSDAKGGAWRFFVDARSAPGNTLTSTRSSVDWLTLLASGVLTVGCFLTGSRGAGISLVVAMGVLLVGDTRFRDRGRFRDFVALGVAAIWLGCLLVFLSGINPLERIQARLAGSEGVSIRSLGNRLPIWENAFRAWTADTTRFMIGAGTGQAELAVGQLDEGATLGEYGEYRRACHNCFIEWLLCFGILGLIPGLGLYLICYRQAAILDRVERTLSRRILNLAITLFGMTADVHRHFHWVMMSACLLAMLDAASLGAGMARDPSARRGTDIPLKPNFLDDEIHRWRESRPGGYSLGVPRSDKKMVASA